MKEEELFKGRKIEIIIPANVTLERVIDQDYFVLKEFGSDIYLIKEFKKEEDNKEE